MTSDRPYRDALPYRVARQELIDHSGKQFDPEVVDAFLTIDQRVWFDVKDQVQRDMKSRTSTLSEVLRSQNRAS
jgi:HD-GYP domain-containing protein (c-di-GMP phosphodiesterase class II)